MDGDEALAAVAFAGLGFIMGALLVMGTSIWVLIDAKRIGVKKGQIKGITDMGPVGWFLVCLLLWIIGFPLYLVRRSEYKRLNAKDTPPSLPTAMAGGAAQDFDQQLRRLARLKDDGIISPEEFEKKKKAVLGG